MGRMNYIFDVDGTLTPGDGCMDTSFMEWFKIFEHTHHVYLVTGTDKKNTIRRVGRDVFYRAKRVYCNYGNVVYEGDNEVYNMPWEVPDEIRSFLSKELRNSKFTIRTGNHMDKTSGRIRFSVLGQKGSKEQKNAYKMWDMKTNERAEIASKFNKKFIDHHAAIHWKGLELNITPRHQHKSQMLRDFDGNIKFFGNDFDIGGSDRGLYKGVRKLGGATYKVYDDKHTWELLHHETSIC
tara:strand:+ start:92 stop:805 length:714 start_codon:yes stop_codon:yes gene_type:complete